MLSLRSTLLGIAAALTTTAACSSGALSPMATPGDGDAGLGDAGDDSNPGPIVCGGCNCTQPTTKSATATPAQACAILADSTYRACDTFCKALPGNESFGGLHCTLPADYQMAYAAAADAGADAGDAGAMCPAWSNGVVVECGVLCLGRRTEGIAEPQACEVPSLGQTFASRAYLEAVSVHAFLRLKKELAFYGAPPSLLRAVRRACRDEIRHTKTTVELARRFGVEPHLPEAPVRMRARALLDIARENAVEGSIRETYGAVVGLLEARDSIDQAVRLASARIAMDECRHAELALELVGWFDERLTEGERGEIREAAGEAVRDLRASGDARIVDQLVERVWSRAPLALVA
jgi:hypothetical protein